MCAISWYSVTVLFIQLTQWELGTRYVRKSLLHLVVHHYPLDDGDTDFLVLLDLLDFVRHKFSSFLLLAPSAASWSRARHVNSATRCLRSRSHPLGCSELSAKDRQTTQYSNNSFLVTSWFAEQAALQRVHFLFLCPEDFGGHSQHWPASPWSLVEFQRLSGFNDIWRGAAFMCRFADAVQHPRPTTIYLSWLAVVQKRELQSSVQRTTTKSMPLFSCAQRFHQRYWWVFPCVIFLFTLFFLLVTSL